MNIKTRYEAHREEPFVAALSYELICLGASIVCGAIMTVAAYICGTSVGIESFVFLSTVGFTYLAWD